MSLGEGQRRGRRVHARGPRVDHHARRRAPDRDRASRSRSSTPASRAPRRATRTASSTAGTTPKTAPTPRRRRRAPTPGTRATTRPTTRRRSTFTVTVPADRQVIVQRHARSATASTRPRARPPGCGTRPTRWRPTSRRCNIGKFTIQRDTTPGGLPIINGVRPDQLTATAQTRLDEHRPHPRLLRSEVRPVPVRATGVIVDLTNAGYQMETQTRPEFTSANGLSALAHELAHQWFGDSVAWRRGPRRVVERGLRDVRGLAVGRAHRRHDRPAGVQHPVRARGQHDVLEQHGVRPGRENQYQSATVYQRGAMTLQALRRRSATRSSSTRCAPSTRRSAAPSPRPRTSSRSPSASPARTCATSSRSGSTRRASRARRTASA